MDRGWHVPRDLSVTGWDNNPVGAVVWPSITTVSVDHEQLGRRAVAQLLAELGGQLRPEHDSPITEIIWRESTGPAGSVPPG
jgi:DNA-binding LacI/PurR family transcriptional regulator